MTLALWTLTLLAVLRTTTLPTVPSRQKTHEQLGGFQAVPRAGVGLSLAAVRHLLWLRIVPAADY